MRRPVFPALLLASALLLAGPARAQDDATAAPAPAIRAVIDGQLQAFRHDDGAGAFAFASPDIQAIFQTPDRFMAMVKGAYQPVYRPRSVEFRDLATEAGRLVQRVLLVGPDGVPVIARYLMEQQPDGSWKIDGCTFEKAPEVTA